MRTAARVPMRWIVALRARSLKRSIRMSRMILVHA
jgi:hypothetical protein